RTRPFDPPRNVRKRRTRTGDKVALTRGTTDGSDPRAFSGKGKSPCHPDAAEAVAATDEKLPAGLYVVATPIGNLGDITLRALDVLRRCDAIACEDTRVTAKLTARHAIRRPLLSYHEHNAERMRPELLRRVADGQAIA